MKVSGRLVVVEGVVVRERSGGLGLSLSGVLL